MKPNHANQSPKSFSRKSNPPFDPQLNDLFNNYQINKSEVALYWENQPQDEFIFEFISEEPISYEKAFALGLAPADLGAE